MVNYTLTRTNRKTVALYVRDGAIEVRAPLKMPKRDIDKFVASREKWINDNLAKSAYLKKQRESFLLNYGDTALYRGKEYPIAARSGDRVGFDGATGEFYIPPNLSPEHIKAAIIKVYKTLAKYYLAERLHHYQAIMGVSVTNFGITGAKKRWGSMSSGKSVNFSWRLIMAEDDVIDVVVVHELAHITEMNHSDRFWAIVEGVLPDRREREKRLKEFNRKISAQNWETYRDVATNEENAQAEPGTGQLSLFGGGDGGI